MDSTQPSPTANKPWWNFWKKEDSDSNQSADLYDMQLERASFTDLIENPETLTARQKKWKRFTSMAGNAKNNAIQGAMVGAMVGGMFGFLIGVYTAMQTRRLISIPLSVLVSGGTFGFIMGCGSMIRS